MKLKISSFFLFILIWKTPVVLHILVIIGRPNRPCPSGMPVLPALFRGADQGFRPARTLICARPAPFFRVSAGAGFNLIFFIFRLKGAVPVGPSRPYFLRGGKVLGSHPQLCPPRLFADFAERACLLCHPLINIHRITHHYRNAQNYDITKNIKAGA